MRTSGSRGCLAALFGIGGRKKSNRPRRGILDYRTSETSDAVPGMYPYRVRDDFLSNAEKTFYRVLKQVVGDRALIFTKVGLWDIFFVARPRQNFKAKARIDRKHVDFLLCHPETIQPLVALELDDSSHQRADRIERDEFVDAVFETAQLPLIHIPVQYGYNTGELAAKLTPYLDNEQQLADRKERNAPPATVQVNAKGIPLCPKCGAPMVIRVASRGQHQGERFYACPNYPKCKSVIPIK